MAKFSSELTRLVDNFEARIHDTEARRKHVLRASSYSSEPQPRYAPYRHDDDLRWGYHGQFPNIGSLSLDAQPAYSTNSRELDSWLANIWRAEPWLAGIIAQMTMMDKNRQYSVVGPRSTVERVVEIFSEADMGQGFRVHREALAQSFYTTNVGAVIQWVRRNIPGTKGSALVDEDTGEILELGALDRIAYYDPTQCTLTGRWRTPIRYHGRGWFPSQTKGLLALGLHSRLASMQHIQERLNGLGYCFVMRVLPIMRIALAAQGAFREAMDSRSPTGFLLLSGVDDSVYRQAIEQLGAQLDAEGRIWFAGMGVLANTGKVDGKYLPFSNIPQGLTLDGMYEWAMKGYANAAGYPVETFTQIQTGRGFGRAGEMEASNRRAENSGRNEFALSHQEALQSNLPDRVHFEYERHDSGERLTQAEVALAWIKVAEGLVGLGIQMPDALSMLVTEEVVPPHLTKAVEDSVITDAGKLLDAADKASGAVEQMEQEVRSVYRARALENPTTRAKIQSAADDNVNEPIVRYLWTVRAGWPLERCVTLWDSPSEALKRTVFPVAALNGHMT